MFIYDKSSSQQVNVEHVHEASKLLSKSIVRIEQPDIVLQEDDALLETEVRKFISFYSEIFDCSRMCIKLQNIFRTTNI